MSRIMYGLMIVGLALFALTGCGSDRDRTVDGEPTAVSDLMQASVALPAETATPIPTPTLPPPLPTAMPVFQLEEAPPTATTSAGFAPVAPAEVATRQTTPTQTAVPTATPSPTITPTPIPTFTPPALPQTSEEDHYWLRRPIAEGGTVWTNKVYPYGGTRGGMLRPHHGVEFDVGTGTEVFSAASGTVVFSGQDTETLLGPELDFYGTAVVIELDSRYEGEPVYTLYAHLSETFVTEGQHVGAEELIALSGATGVADGPHLHFEVRVGENSYNATRNPSLWLYPFPDRGTVAGRVVWSGGTLAREAPVNLYRIDAESRYLAAVTYAGRTVNADDQWNETFVIDDVPAGYYEAVVDTGSKKFKEEIWVFPYRTTFVEIVIE